MFSANVHYVDQKTDKTLFVDTGSSISLRRTEISAPAVALALEMAQQRFGNTLSINGNDEFKKMVVDAAVEKQLPIQYTDSGLNQQIAARLSELESIKHEQDRVSVNFTREFLSGLQPESPVERSVEATKDETQTTPRSLAFTLNGEPASLGLRQVDLPKGMDLEAPQPQGNEAPLPLAFTFNGETASLGLRPAQSESPLVQTNQVGGTMAAPQPLNFVHNGETASLGLRSTQSLPEHVSPVIEEGETDFSDVDSDSYDLHYRDHLEHPDFEEAGLEYPDSGEDLEIPDYDPSDD
nr:LPD7 domain-containing protein [Pseudomonas corrugata]